MIKILKSFLPLGLFFLIILFVGYFVLQIWKDFLDVESTPIPTQPTSQPVPTTSSTPTPTYTPTPIAIVNNTVTPSLTPLTAPVTSPSAVTSPTIDAAVSPPVMIIPVPTPTPVLGVVIPFRLNVREGPSVNYGIVAGLEEGDQVTILNQTLNGEWLEVVTPDNKTGWVAASQIGAEIDSVPVTVVGPTPPPVPTTTISGKLLNLRQELDLDVEGDSVAGEIGPHQEQWYTFFEEDVETVIIFFFKPNVNVYGINFQAYYVQFYLHGEDQIPFWPPGDPVALEDFNIGAGSYEGDRDKNYGTGELVWRGGSFERNVRYYLRLVNRSSIPIQYCLIPKDVREWVCPKN